ncbi:MAG: hypothetical protein ACAI43_07265, partial [Phycisphaerae bacterium]
MRTRTEKLIVAVGAAEVLAGIATVVVGLFVDWRASRLMLLIGMPIGCGLLLGSLAGHVRGDSRGTDRLAWFSRLCWGVTFLLGLAFVASTVVGGLSGSGVVEYENPAVLVDQPSYFLGKHGERLKVSRDT